MLTRWELEWELRQLHPFRDRAMDRKRELASTRQLLRMGAGVAVGLVLVGALAMARWVRTPKAIYQGRQVAVWGTEWAGSDPSVHRGAPSFLPDAWRRGWHPHDPRARGMRGRRAADEG